VASFETVVDDYDAARPAYPAAVYDHIEAAAGGLVGKLVGDGGAGTGVATRQLLGRGAEVIAFDPGLAVLARAVLRTPGLRAIAAGGGALPLRAASLDLLCFAQSWHWVDQRSGAAEVARVLRSGGWWAAWWNHAWADSEGWFEDYYRLLEARCPGVSRAQRDTDWSRESIAATGDFESVEQKIVPWVRAVTIDTWIRDQRSHSYVIALTEQERATLLREAEVILHAGFPEGQMVVAYQCRLWLARRR